MWPKLVIGVVALRIMCSVVKASGSNSEDVRSLPYCPNKNGSGTVLVSTLDGKLSAINASGHLTWEIETGPGPLLTSNIHKLELTNNGEWIRIIPSLSGTLYKFDGSTIDPISINTEALLRSSFRYSDDLVIAGGVEVRTYGVGFRTGTLFYECSPSKCTHHKKDEMDDVMVVERSTQTIRAVEPRTGHERWNFSVGLHNVKLPQVSCIDTKLFDSNISAIIPDGLLFVSSIKNNVEHSWQYKFHSPIVRVWKWDGMKLSEINLFEPKNMPNAITTTPIYPSIYVGMHKKQLYIHESLDMQQILQGRQNTDLLPAESSSLAKIPWKPISASSEPTEDDSTALSVLNNSEYVNGNGYYLYSEHDLKEKDNLLCDNNSSSSKVIDAVMVEEEIVHGGFLTFLGTYLGYYKQYALMVFTAILGPLLLFKFWNKGNPKNQEIIIIEKPVEAEVIRPERQNSERSVEGFTSRFVDDFDTIQCLGKGGFGVVFEVKQKYDDCHYAIKRITLPNEEKSRTRVMREVKALAKLDHKNIVRYFSCWLEHPPLGWEEEHDKNWMESSFSGIPTSTDITASPSKRTKSYSISIDIPLQKCKEPSFDSDSGSTTEDEDEDSFVVFEKDDSPNQISQNTTTTKDDDDSFIVFQTSVTKENTSEAEDSLRTMENETVFVATEALSISDHLKRKIDWRRPGRKHHSWDLTQNSAKSLFPREPPMYLYIQMQLCQKESLKEWLSLHKDRNYDYMLDIFVQILDAVEYVHLRKLIHRDLKPSNIFFSLDGQVKVGDFGLVKDIESSIDLELTRRNAAASYRGHTKEVGTTLYMSPEQSKGRIYDYKVDIYSLGVILFELLVPFSTDMERIKTLTDLKVQKYPDGFAEKFPAEFSLLQNMLNEDPNKRLTTIGIRARSPFNQNNNSTPDDQHFSLITFQQNLN